MLVGTFGRSLHVVIKALRELPKYAYEILLESYVVIAKI